MKRARCLWRWFGRLRPISHREQSFRARLLGHSRYFMVDEALWTVFQQREHARVPRDDLPQLIHPGSRSAEKRADAAPAIQAISPCTLGLVDSPAVRSSMPSPSGKGPQRLKIVPYRRSAQRHRQQSHRNPGGTTFAFHHSGQSKDTATVVDALTRQVRRLAASLRRCLTRDRGLDGQT